MQLTCGDGTTEPPADPNRAPEPVGTIPNQEVAYNALGSVNVAEYFRDPDGDPLAFSAATSDAGVAAVTVAGSMVTTRAVSRGTETVTVTATDPAGLTASQRFDAMVPNEGPEAVGGIADQRLEVGDSLAIGVAAHFTDPEGDPLAFSATSSDTLVARVEVDGDSVRLVALAKGMATVTVTARDPAGVAADQSFTVTVPNRAPFVAETIPADSALLGDTLDLVLNPYFADPDGDSLGFSAESSDPVVAMARVTGRTLVVVPVVPGRATITVTASDPEGLSAAQSFEVMAVNPNRAPVAVGEISDRLIHVGATDSLNVSTYFSDPDGDSLSYTAETSRRIRVAVAAHGDIIALKAVSVGSSTITVTARDPDGLPARQRFRAVVEPVPTPDLVVGTPTIDRDSVEVEGEFTLTAVVRNQGEGKSTSSTTLRFVHSNNPRITASDSLLGTHQVGRLDTAAMNVGSLTVHAPATPGTYYYGACVEALENEAEAGNNCSSAASIRVWQPNRAPHPAGTIPLQETAYGDSSLVNLPRYFRDPDGDSLRFTAMSSDTAIAWVAVTGSVAVVRGRSRGTATITVTATDPGGLSARQVFGALVPNRGPEPTGAIDDRRLVVDDSVMIGVSVYFTDPESDSLTLSAESSDLMVTSVGVSGDSLRLVALAEGTATVTVTARDPAGEVAVQRFRVIVDPVPAPDLVVDAPTVDRDSVEVEGEFTLTAVVRNQGEGKSTSSTTLRFVHSNNPRITASDSLLGTHQVGRLDTAAMSVGSLMVHAPATPGTYYYGACVEALENEAEAGNNCSSAASIRVWQPNRAPHPAGTIPLQETAYGDSSLVNLPRYFRDPDGDSLRFTAMSSDTAIARVAVTGSVAVVRGRSRGTATITVTATDPGGLSARQEFGALVPNRGPEPTGVIDDRQLVVGDSVMIGVSVYFSDPESDSLTLSAESSDLMVTSVGVSGDSLRLVALAEGTATVTVTARDPAGEVAVQRFRVIVDPVPAPDLVVDAPTVDRDSVKVEGEFTLTAVVRNQGNADAQSATLRYYESSDADVTPDDRDLGTGAVTALGPGESSELSMQVSAPSEVGTRYYGACVDAPSTEIHTGNNCSAGVPVRFRPPNHKPEPGDSFRARSMEPGNRVRFDLARFFTDPDGDSLRFAAASSDSAIVAVSVSRGALTIEARALGSATIEVTAQDVTTRAPGGLTASQSFEVTVRVRPRPDLVVDLTQDSFAIGPQQSFLVRAVVRNEGTRDVPSGTTVRFFLASDTTIGPDDSEIGTATLGPVAAPGQQTVSVTLASAADAGVYYYGACVDAVTDESSRDNNCSGALVVVVDELKRPNRGPTATGFRDITDAEPGQRYRGALEEVFTDPDGDPLDYSAESSDDAVARPEIAGDTLFLYTLGYGTATITVTATDPGGLSATTDFEVSVPEPCTGFCILRGFTPTVTDAQRARIHAAADRWEAILAATELSDVDLGDGFKCVNLNLPDGIVVDDHLFIAHVRPIDGPGGTLASAGFCEQRADGFPTVSRAVFDAFDIEVLVSEGMLADVAFHELAHGLGYIHGRFNSLGLLNTGTEPHFTGSGARAAFDAAGGAAYSGPKVPMAPDLSHWSESVFDVEMMTPLLEIGVPQPVSAITLQAMADLGYSVNVGLASSYTLPSARPPLAAMGQPRRVFDLSGDVDQGPVTIRGPDGQVVDVIPPPPGYAPPPAPSHKVTIDLRSRRPVGRPPESLGPLDPAATAPDPPRAAASLYVSWVRDPDPVVRRRPTR